MGGAADPGGHGLWLLGAFWFSDCRIPIANNDGDGDTNAHADASANRDVDRDRLCHRDRNAYCHRDVDAATYGNAYAYGPAPDGHFLDARAGLSRL